MDMPEEYVNFKYKNAPAREWYEYAYKRIFDRIDLNSEDTALDFGCGAGDIIKKYIAPKVKKAYGVDISQEMLEAAKESNPEENVEFIQGDFEKLMEEFEGNGMMGNLDKFTSFFVINFFEDYVHFFENIYKLLKPGGVMGLAIPMLIENRIVPNLFKEEKWGKYLENGPPITKQAEWMYYFDISNVHDFQAPLIKIGFKISDYTYHSVRVPFSDMGHLGRILTLWDPHFQLIPQEEREEFLEDFQNYATTHMDDLALDVDGKTGTVFMLFNQVTVVAQK